MSSAETWYRVCRKATSFKDIKQSVCDAPGIKKLPFKRHLNEITMMRRETRLNNFLMPANDENNPLKSIDDIPLDYDLLNIKYNAAANYKNYKANYVTKSSFGCEIKYPIFITPKD